MAFIAVVNVVPASALPQFENAGCGACPQLATPSDVRLCKKQNACNKPVAVADPVVDPGEKPGKKHRKKYKKNTSRTTPCGNGECDEAGGESFETCPSDCLCGNGECDAGEMTCEIDCCIPTGDCTPTTCDDNVEGIKGLTTLVESLVAMIETSDVKIEALDAKIEALKASQVKNTWITGVGNDMLIVIIMLSIILMLLILPWLRKEEEEKEGDKSPGSAPGKG